MAADSELVRTQFEAIAEAWERLADERLAALEAQSSAAGDAMRSESLKPSELPDG